MNVTGRVPCPPCAQIVDELIQRGADLELSNDSGWTPIHVAAENAHVWALWQLMQAGGDANRRDSDGDTPLHVAVSETNRDRCEEALSDGGDVGEMIRTVGVMCRTGDGALSSQLAGGNTLLFFSTGCACFSVIEL